VFVYWEGKNPDELGDKLSDLAIDGLPLSMITNRGIKVYPNGFDETFCTDHWRCRFLSESPIGFEDVLKTLETCHANGIDVIKTEHLYQFDGVKAFSMGQGQ
jgi:isocitrate dehydrogenase